jgi:hypothetical protein
LLPASALWVAVGNFVIVPGGPASNLAVNLLANLGPVLLLIGFGYLGFRAWAERAPAEHVGQGADGQPGRGGRPSLGVGAGRTAAESVRRDRKNTLFRGSTMGLRRWFYAGGRPKLMARLLDRGTAAVSARGVGPEYLVALEVPGRQSERTVSLPLVVATVGGERYLVSMLGEGVNWVRNVRAAGGDAALRHGCREEVHLQEVVAPDLRAPVLKAYLKRAINANAHMPIDKDAPLAEFERLPLRFPVFRIVTRSNG